MVWQVRKQQRASKHTAEEHAAAVLGLEAKLAGKQQEAASLQQLNQRLFARFQSLREQLAHSQDKLSHTQLRGVPCSHCLLWLLHAVRKPECKLRKLRLCSSRDALLASAVMCNCITAGTLACESCDKHWNMLQGWLTF